MPPAERLEEIGALATIIDENRFSYSLDALCTWRGLPGKDESELKEAAVAAGMPKRAKPQSYIWQLPARFVGPYAEADAANTLALFESLDPILDREGTRDAYRLEVDLLPMVLEMRRRGIRIDVDAAERARDHLLAKRDAVFAEISEKLGAHCRHGRDRPQQVAGRDLRQARHQVSAHRKRQPVIHRRQFRMDAAASALAAAADRQGRQAQQCRSQFPAALHPRPCRQRPHPCGNPSAPLRRRRHPLDCASATAIRRCN